MKTLRLIFLCNLALTFNFALGQQTATLACDIEALEGGANPAEACYFTEDPEVNPELFTIEAQVGEEITWEGEDRIVIRKIQYYKGRNIFDKDPEGNGQIKARPNQKTEGDPYYYRIHFKIDGTEKNFIIDPIIRTR